MQFDSVWPAFKPFSDWHYLTLVPRELLKIIVPEARVVFKFESD